MDVKDIVNSKRKKEIQKCESCDKIFSFKSSLIKHARIHTGEKPYSCEVEGCNQTFSQVSNLIRHKRIHEGVRPYSCSICSKSFSSTSNLKQHENIHKKINSRFKYICFINKCNKHYYYVCTLKKHLISAHRSSFQKLTNNYPGKNFYEIFRLIKDNISTVKAKFDFIDFKEGESTTVDDCKEYVKEKRKRFKCTLSGRAVAERNEVGVWKKTNENENMKCIYPNVMNNFSEGLPSHRFDEISSTKSNEKKFLSAEGNNVNKERNGTFELINLNNQLKGNFINSTEKSKSSNKNSCDTNLNCASPLHFNNDDAQNNMFETYRNFLVYSNFLQNNFAQNSNLGNFSSYANNFANSGYNCNPFNYLNQLNLGMYNAYSNLGSNNLLEMLRRVSEINNNNYYQFKTESNVNAGNYEGNIEFLKLLNFLNVNNFIDKTNINANTMNDTVLSRLSGLAQQSGLL